MGKNYLIKSIGDLIQAEIIVYNSYMFFWVHLFNWLSQGRSMLLRIRQLEANLVLALYAGVSFRSV